MKILYILILFLFCSIFSPVLAQDIPESVRVTGIGAASPEQTKLMALRTAMVDGYRKLAEIINGIHLTSETQISDLITKNDKITTEVEAIIRNAQIENERYLSDNSVEIDFFISNDEMKKILQLSDELRAINKDGEKIEDANGDGIPDTWGNVHEVSQDEWTDIVYEQWAEYNLSKIDGRSVTKDAEIPRTIINGNFEDPNLAGWTLDGDAWANNPLKYGDEKIEGNYFLGSFDAGHEAQGTVISDPFLITQSKIIFLIGGGKHPRGRPHETTINLIINGENIYSATGNNDNSYTEIVWDMGHHQGSIAQIKIIDTCSDKNGYIFVDNIRMTH